MHDAIQIHPSIGIHPLKATATTICAKNKTTSAARDEQRTSNEAGGLMERHFDSFF
jgi:hypothetical protein